MKDLSFFSDVLKNKKISSHIVRRKKNSVNNKAFIYFPSKKVDKTKTQIKIPNKASWPACNDTSMDTQIIILSPKIITSILPQSFLENTACFLKYILLY